jgi:hypothetical protein
MFFDFFALGDGEELLVEIGRCLQACRAERLDREATLFRLATTVDGVYVPQVWGYLGAADLWLSAQFWPVLVPQPGYQAMV